MFVLRLAQYGLRNVLCHVTRPAFGGVEGDDPNGMRVLTAQNVLDSGLFVSFVVARLGIGATQPRTILVQHDIDGDIKGGLARYQQGLVTHDTLHDGRRVGCPDQNVPSRMRVAAGAFGFLALIQVFDSSER